MRETTTYRKIYKVVVYIFAALLTAAVVSRSIKVDPELVVLYGVAFGVGFVVGRQTKGQPPIQREV